MGNNWPKLPRVFLLASVGIIRLQESSDPHDGKSAGTGSAGFAVISETMNTALEQELFCSRRPAVHQRQWATSIKRQLVDERVRALIVELLREGNTDEGFDSGFDAAGQCGVLYGRLSGAMRSLNPLEKLGHHCMKRRP